MMLYDLFYAVPPFASAPFVSTACSCSFNAELACDDALFPSTVMHQCQISQACLMQLNDVYYAYSLLSDSSCEAICIIAR